MAYIYVVRSPPPLPFQKSIIHFKAVIEHQGPILRKWFNFNPSMDKLQ